MTMLEKYIDCMERGDNVALADLFAYDGVLHDSSLRILGKDRLHLEGRMAIEMMFHHKFGFNGGPFPIHSVKHHSDTNVWYFIEYNGRILPVSAFLSETNGKGEIKRLSIYPL